MRIFVLNYFYLSLKYVKIYSVNKMDNKNKYSEYLKDVSEFNECEDDFCDLDKTKICDNCGKCLEEGKNYKIIKITKIVKEN